MYKNILIPTDDAELSEKVARDGASLARALNARTVGAHVIRLLYVASAGVDYGLFDPTLEQRIHETARADGKRVLDRMEAAVTAAGAPFGCVLVRTSSPGKELSIPRRSTAAT